MARFHRQRNLAPKPRPLSFGEPVYVPDPYGADTPDLQRRSKLHVTERAGFTVETLGAPLPAAD